MVLEYKKIISTNKKERRDAKKKFTQNNGQEMARIVVHGDEHHNVAEAQI